MSDSSYLDGLRARAGAVDAAEAPQSAPQSAYMQSLQRRAGVAGPKSFIEAFDVNAVPGQEGLSSALGPDDQSWAGPAPGMTSSYAEARNAPPRIPAGEGVDVNQMPWGSRIIEKNLRGVEDMLGKTDEAMRGFSFSSPGDVLDPRRFAEGFKQNVEAVGKTLWHGGGLVGGIALGPAMSYLGDFAETADPSNPANLPGIVVGDLTTKLMEAPEVVIEQATQHWGISRGEAEALFGFATVAAPALKSKLGKVGIETRKPGFYESQTARAAAEAAVESPLVEQARKSAAQEGTVAGSRAAKQAGTYADAVTNRLDKPSGPPQPFVRPEPPAPEGVLMGEVRPTSARAGLGAETRGPLPGMERVPEAPPPAPEPYMGLGGPTTAKAGLGASTEGPLPSMDVPPPPAPEPYMGLGGPTTAKAGLGAATEGPLPSMETPIPPAAEPHPLMGGDRARITTRIGRLSERGSVGPGGGARLPRFGEAMESIRSAWERTAERVTGVAAKTPGAEKFRQWFIHEPETISAEYAQKVYDYRGRRNLGKARGVYDALELRKTLRGLDDATTDAVMDYMGSESNSLPQNLTPKQKATVEAVTARIRQSSDALLERGILSPEAHAEYPRYIRRIYEAYRGDRGGIWAKGTRPRLGKTIARMDAYNIKVRGRLEDFQSMLSGLESKYEKAQGKTTLIKFTSAQDRAIFQERLKANRRSSAVVKGSVTDPIPKELREILGEIREPGQAVYETVLYNNAKIASYDLLNEITKGRDRKGAWSLERGESVNKAPKHNTTEVINGTEYTYLSSDKLGPLSDRWVRSDIAADVKGNVGMMEPGEWQNIKRVWNSAISEWKANRTTRSTTTQALNILSLDAMFEQAGVSVYDPRNWKYIAEAVKRQWKDNPYDPATAARIAQEVTGVTFTDVELSGGRGGSFVGRLIGSGGLAALERAPGVAKGWGALNRAANRAYAFYDNIVRDAAYSKHIANGMSPDRATIEVNRYTPNYERVGPAVKALRQSPVGSPFLSFAYEQKRILVNNLRRHPVRALRTLGMTYLKMKAIESLLADDVTDEEKAALQRTGGGWGPFRREAAVGRDEEGNVRMFQLGALDPNDEILRGPEHDINVGPLGMPTDLVNWALYAGQLAGVQANPAYDALVTLARGRTRYGKELRDVGDYGEYAWSQLGHPQLPGGSKVKKVTTAMDPNKRSMYARIQTPLDAILDAITHISLGTYTPEQANAILLREFQSRSSKIKAEAREDVRESPDEREEIAGKARAELRTLTEKAREEQRLRVAR